MDHLIGVKSMLDWQRTGLEVMNNALRSAHDQSRKVHQQCWEQGLNWFKQSQKVQQEWMGLCQKEMDNVHSFMNENLHKVEQYLETGGGAKGAPASRAGKTDDAASKKNQGA